MEIHQHLIVAARDNLYLSHDWRFTYTPDKPSTPDPAYTREHIIEVFEKADPAPPRPAKSGGKKQPAKAKKTGPYKKPDTVVEGDRDEELTAFAGWRRGKPNGDDDDQLLAAMIEFNAGFDPPLSDSYVQHKWRYFCYKFAQWTKPPDGERVGGQVGIFRCMADIEPEPIDWLWEQRFARGKVTMMAGNPGLGKSLLTMGFAACVSSGGLWPDLSPCEQGGVLILSAEDDAADTIRPRLDAAGADVSRIHILEAVHDPDSDGERCVTLDTDLHILDEGLEHRPDITLVIVDPITSYMGSIDDHKNAAVKGLLARLYALAKKHEVAVLIVSHLNKSQGTAAAYRISGSLGYHSSGRATYAVVSNPADPSNRILTPVKNNIGDDRTGFSYNINSDAEGRPVVMWDSDPVMTPVDDLLDADARGDGTKGQPRRSAARWLLDLLKDGPVLVHDIQEQARVEGHSWSTVQRARSTEFITYEKANEYQGTVQWRLMTPEETAKAIVDQNPDAPEAEGEIAEEREF